jgi:hypothetical protein
MYEEHGGKVQRRASDNAPVADARIRPAGSSRLKLHAQRSPTLPPAIPTEVPVRVMLTSSASVQRSSRHLSGSAEEPSYNRIG